MLGGQGHREAPRTRLGDEGDGEEEGLCLGVTEELRGTYL